MNIVFHIMAVLPRDSFGVWRLDSFNVFIPIHCAQGYNVRKHLHNIILVRKSVRKRIFCNNGCYFIVSVDASYDSTILYPNEDDKFSLTELVDTYSSLLPLKVCVVKGFYGDRGEDCAIAVDEIYNFHFVKRARVSE